MRKRKSAVPSFIGGGTILALMIAAIVIFRPEDLDPLTGCPKSGPKTTTVVVVDTSDPLSTVQQVKFGKFLDTLIKPPRSDEQVTPNSDSANYVPKGHLLVAYKIMENEEAEPELLFRKCNPGNPDDRELKDKFSEGEIVAILRWREFVQELTDAFPKAMLNETSTVSPIIETLKYVRAAEFPGAAQLKTADHKAGSLLIVSDMLQNSSKLSHLGGLPPTENVPAQYALDLTGIDIGIRYLKVDRYSHLQSDSRPHFKWWREFFAIAGAPLNKPPGVW